MTSLNSTIVETPKTPVLFRSSQAKKSDGKLDVRKLRGGKKSSDSDSDNSPKKSKVKASSFLKKAKGSSSDEEDERARRRAEEKRHRQMMMKSCVEIENDANLPIQDTIEQFMTPQEAIRNLEEGLSLLSTDREKFIQESFNFEGEQLYLWIKAAADQPLLHRFPQQPYHDPITQIAADFFVRHRFAVGSNSVYRFQGAILGPRRSGKSTLLGSALDQFLIELASTGRWKSTFVLAIDMKLVASLFGDYAKFYQFFLDRILNALAKQKPMVRSDLKNIRNQLRSVTEMRPPLGGHHSYPLIDGIAYDLNQAWRDPDSFDAFLTKVFLLAVSLPKAVGFESVSLFLDNLDYCDIELFPHEPFTIKQNVAIAVENLKVALALVDFIVTTESGSAIYDVLRPTDDRSVDLLSRLDIITLYEATQDLGSRARYDYHVQLLGESTPIRLDVGMCGGIVTYLGAWDELHHALFRLEKLRRDEDNYREVYFDAIGEAQKLVDLILVSPNSPHITVCSVSRQPCGNTGIPKPVQHRKGVTEEGE
jgi:hypothetical protein